MSWKEGGTEYVRMGGKRPLEGESQQMTASVVTHIPHTSPQRGKKWVHGHNNNARALQSPGKIPLPHKWCKSETMVAYSPGCPTPPTWPHPRDPEVQTGHPNMGQCTLHGVVAKEACTTPTRRDPATSPPNIPRPFNNTQPSLHFAC